MTLDHPPIAGQFGNAADLATRKPQKSKAAPPFSLRLSAEEKAELLRRAGKEPLGAFIRAQLLGDAATVRRALRKPIEDEQALARVLAALGNARLSSNLNQLAKAANCGSLPVTHETIAALNAACRDVRWMRDTLVQALGLRPAP